MRAFTEAMREWNAEAYHRVSDPQLRWGLRVLERLPIRGDELVLDVGCGTGRLTEHLLDRLPDGCVLALDASANMVRAAREYLGPRAGGRARFVRGDAAALPVSGAADGIFSTATFHWVLDHAALFRSLRQALRPGGVLVAQCGGGPNIKRVHDRCEALMRHARFAPYYHGWREPWNFADVETTEARLAAAGFVHIHVTLESAPVVQPDAPAYRDFVTNVVCRHHLAHLPDRWLREQFMDAITAQASADPTPFELDYWRLNLDARAPA